VKKMLDLDSIFDPDRPLRPDPAPVPIIGPDDLPGEWHLRWDERAAIMEFDGGMAREVAEVEALKDILNLMRNPT